MRSLKPMHRVGRPQLARLHNESQQARGQRQKKERIAQPSSNPRTHGQDSNTRQASGFHFRPGMARKIEQGNQRDTEEAAALQLCRPTESPAHTIECVSGPNLLLGCQNFTWRCSMKKMFLGMVLLASATLFAQSPFDGTWMTKLDTAKLPTKPDKNPLSNKGATVF